MCCAYDFFFFLETLLFAVKLIQEEEKARVILNYSVTNRNTGAADDSGFKAALFNIYLLTIDKMTV